MESLTVYYMIMRNYVEINYPLVLQNLMIWNMWFQHYALFLYQYCRIHFFEWLQVSGIESSSSSNVKWIVYTYMGHKYRIPFKKTRGPSNTINPLLVAKFGNMHDQVLGPYNDYHGQEELLLNM